MKRLTVLLAAALLLFSGCESGAEVFEDDNEHWEFYQPCVHELDSVPGFLIKEYTSEEEWEAWTEKYESMTDCRKMTDYPNVYTFITDFGVSDEDITELYDGYDIMSERDMEILLTRDEAKIAEYFATEYTIVVGSCVYPPEWVYSHSPKDYAEAGITPEMLEEKSDEYSALGLSEEAAEILGEKLSEYAGADISLPKRPCLTVGEKEFDAGWLSSHDITDYDEAGITADAAEAFLSEQGESLSENEREWIESCIERMRQ